MDPNLAAPTTIDTVADLLTGGVLTTVAGLSATGIGVALYSLRRRATWHRVGAELGLRQETAGRMVLGALPALSGIYRGRAIEASLLPSSQTRISIRVANPRHLLDQIRADDAGALAGALWLTARQRDGIRGLRDSLRRPSGSIAVKGSFVTLIAPAAGASIGGEEKQNASDRLRALLVLAHGIAESVDAATGAFVATPVRGRRRCGPGTLSAQRRG